MKVDYTLYSPATQVQLARWRQDVLNGTITNEQLQAAIVAMRGERESAVRAAAASASKSTGRKRVSKEEKVAAIDTSKLMEGF